MERVTLRDIALQLGLSESTISRGIRDDPRLPPKTRKRIQDACEKAGYHRDPLLSEIGAARWRRSKVARGSLIAYVTCVTGDEPYVDLAEYTRQEASRLGYEVRIFDRGAYSSSAKLQKALRNHGITEVVLGPVYNESLKIRLNWKDFICVQLLPGLFTPPLHSVTRDHFNGVIMAWREAVRHGYRRIGVTLLEHPYLLMDDVQRKSAIHACQQYLFPALPSIPPFLYSESNKNGVVAWAKTHRPDVVIGFNEATYRILRADFSAALPFAALHAEEESPTTALREMAGIPIYTSLCAREGIQLLDYCRRTHQRGLPKQRIDQILEPVWFEGTSMPWKTS